jgi:hypothetical protein
MRERGWGAERTPNAKLTDADGARQFSASREKNEGPAQWSRAFEDQNQIR